MSEWRSISEYPYSMKWATTDQCLCAHAEKKWVRVGRYYPEIKRWYYSGTSEQSQWSHVEGDEPTHFMKIPDLPS